MGTASKVILGFVAGAGLVTALTATVVFGHGFEGCDGPGGYWLGRIERRLALTPEQSAKLDQVVDQFHQARGQWRTQRSEDLAQLRELIVAPQLDQQQVLALINRKTTTVNQQAPAIVAELAAFTDSLTVEQKDQIIALMNQRMDRRNRFQELSGNH